MQTDHSQNLGNKYQLLDLLGSGGMAEVYRCRMIGTMGFEKLVVIKKLLSQFAHDPEIVAQFISEAKLAALLQHENIVYVYDFGEIDGSYFLAMEYLFGKDLQSVMQRAGEKGDPLGAELALQIAARICEGMEYAHSLQDLQQRPLNLIHRDLSPHNVFITYDGKVKIIDFGIARAELFDHRTKAGMVKGKISYMSPEQLTAENIDRRSDIFSIGILLYEMLCGKRMYRGDTATLIRKCMQVEFDELQILVPGLPPAIYRILGKALAKDRTDRYESCARMRADIEECLFEICGRPTTDNLQTYILRLFALEFEEEKKGLLSATLGAAPGSADGKGSDTRQNNAASVDIAGSQRTVLPPVTENRPASDSSVPDAGAVPLLPGGKGVGQRFLSTRRWVMLLTVALGCLLGLVLRGGQPDKKADVAVELPSPPLVASLPEVQAEVEPEPPAAVSDHRGNSVQTLLVQAEQAVSDKSLKKPGLGLALNAYRRVLAIQPDNTVALQGIRRIGELYGNFAEQAMKANNYSEAAAFIHKGLAAAPADRRLLALQTSLAEQRREAIKKLAEKAEEALQVNRLTVPTEACAYKYYLDILRIEGNNSLAMQGINRIADRYAELAEEAYRDLNINKSREYVRQGLAIAPRHRQLLQLQNDLSRSIPGMFFKSLEKSFSPIFK